MQYSGMQPSHAAGATSAGGSPVVSRQRGVRAREASLRTYLPWGVCVAFLVATGLFIRHVGGGLEDDPRRGLFGPLPVALVALVGGIGVSLAARTGFPSAWDARVDQRVRFAYPIAVGILLGLVSVGLEVATGGIAFFLEDMALERFNAPLPGSLLLYPAGAIVLEVVYRLLPIPLLLWIALRLGLPERHRLTLFWALALVTSLLEPLGQAVAAFEAGRADIALSQFALSFVYNLAQAYWFLVGGFLSSLSLRLGHYTVWHVIYGGLICAC